MIPHTFLVEIGTEELPPKALRTIAECFADAFKQALSTAHLTYGTLQWFATPRRLALKLSQLAPAQPDTVIEQRGPALSQAFNSDGEPTQAALSWAQRCGINIEQAQQTHTNKGSWLIYRAHKPGCSSASLLIELVNQALKKLTFPKLMYWSDHPIPFIRPIQTVTLLLGDQLIPGFVLGVATTRTLHGHRWMGETEFTLDQADHYPQVLLERGKVMADYMARKAYIQAEISKAAATLEGKADVDDALLEEVTALVEWPVILSATFDAQFLSVPAEALTYTMKKDQKYFPLYDLQGKLLPRFLFVANIASTDPNRVIQGNEKVIRPRLADAQFFFNSDRKHSLADYLPRLANILFQQHLGTLQQRAYRLNRLSALIAERIDADSAQAARAGLLAKCDLATQMVFEFPETQGAIGMHYARYDGEEEQIALAIKEHYLPRFSGDSLPTTRVSCAVALADKMDLLVGIISIKQRPTGDKDPFALRRAALGVLRIIIEKQLPLDIADLARQATMLYSEQLALEETEVVTEVVEFVMGRLHSWYQTQDFASEIIQAVLARCSTQPSDVDARVRALAHFCKLESANALAAANKRVFNLLNKSKEVLPTHLDHQLLREAAEQMLVRHIEQLRDNQLPPLFNARRYQEALTALSTLHAPIATFFEQVMVMADDPAVRLNRLRLLHDLQQLFLQIADISLLA